MKYLSQRDSRWAKETIGTSKIVIGRYGCTITCISMLSDYFKRYLTPLWMAKNLKFTPDGLLLWQSINGKLPFNFVNRFYGRQSATIKECIADPDKACILQINGFHWVVAVKVIPSGYRVIDPWTGNLTSITATQVTGGATFQRR
ncbi:MAG: hypothetical protein AB9866_18975 [Syntrophobacteraceae bacterium]